MQDSVRPPRRLATIVALSLVCAAGAAAKDTNINLTLQQIIKSHGGCVPFDIISINETQRIRSSGHQLKAGDCVNPSILSEEELTRDRTFEAEQIRHPPTVMTVSWIEDDIKSYHRNVLDPLFVELPECSGVRVMHLGDLGKQIPDVQLAAQWIAQRNPLVVKYSIDTDNIITALDPKSVVRLACFAARAKNPS